jgi:pseudaminic acid synthase
MNQTSFNSVIETSDRVDVSLKAVFVIAEISANHNGSLDAALELVHSAKECGADAVKIQTYTADTLTLDCDNDYFQIGGGTPWDGMTLHQLYQQAYTPWEWHEEIFAEAKRVGIECFSTPFDETAVDFLEQFDPPYHKIASFELVHHPLLKKVAQTGRPVILSTGMATLREIAAAVEILRANGCTDLSLLKCTSSYPAPPEEANLARIAHMAETFQCKAGLSDHTLGIAVPVAAVALGASIIEKHFCRSRSDPGPDSAFSLEPHEFEAMVAAVRIAEKAIGTVTYDRTDHEKAGLAFRRSLFFARGLPAGHQVAAADIHVVRPGYGLDPEWLRAVIGRVTSKPVELGQPVLWDSIG